jgi:chromosome segregation ATPase
VQLVAANTALQSKKEELQSTLETTQMDLQASKKDISTAQRSETLLRSDFITLERDFQRLKGLSDHCNAELVASTLELNRVHSIHHLQSEAKLRCEEELGKLKSRLTEVQLSEMSLKDKLLSLRAVHSNLMSANEDNVAKLRECQMKIGTLQLSETVLCESVVAVTKQYQSVTLEKVSLETEFELFTSKCKQLSLQLEESNTALKSTTEQLALTKLSEESLSQKVDDLAASNRILMSEMSMTESNLKETSLQLTLTQSSERDLQQAISALRQEHETVSRSFEDSSRELHNTRELLLTSQKGEATVGQMLCNVQSVYDALMSSHTKLNLEVVETKAKLASSQLLAISLDEKGKSLQSELVVEKKAHLNTTAMLKEVQTNNPHYVTR